MSDEWGYVGLCRASVLQLIAQNGQGVRMADMTSEPGSAQGEVDYW